MQNEETRTDLTGELGQPDRVTVTRVDRRIVYAILMCFLSCVLFCVVTFVFTTRSASASARHFCSLLETYDSVYREQPPSTPTGTKLATEIHVLVMRLDCHPGQDN
jgi:hypothetical protein